MSQNVVITVSETLEGGLEALTKRLEQVGLEVNKVYAYWVITGCIPSERLAAFGTMKDVLEIKPERRFQLAPPDSAVQ